MDLLKEFFGVGAESDNAATTQATPATNATEMTDEERQQAREAKRETKRANRQARKVDAETERSAPSSLSATRRAPSEDSRPKKRSSI